MTATWKWRIPAAVLAVGLVLLLHKPLLRALAAPLIVAPSNGHFDALCFSFRRNIPDGDRSFDVAAELCRQNPAARVLLIVPAPDRLMEIGVLPFCEAASRRELADRGVPQERISTATSPWFEDWAVARTLDAWMRRQPETSILLLCPQFRSAHMRYVLENTLDRRCAERVRVYPLADRQFDAANWWTSRGGIREFGAAWLVRLHGWLLGGNAAAPSFHNADEYETEFLKTVPGRR